MHCSMFMREDCKMTIFFLKSFKYLFVKDKDQLPYKLGRDFLIQCPGLSLRAPKSQYYVEKKGESYFVM